MYFPFGLQSVVQRIFFVFKFWECTWLLKIIIIYIIIESTQNCCFIIYWLHIQQPVSYTHLDVYKRQVTTRDSVILKLSRTIFLQILEENPEIQKSMLCTFAQKLYDKAVSARMLNNQAPEERILDFLGYFKKKSTSTEDKILIPYTRQELANLTGLRIETVIRTLRKLSETNKVDIINHKGYY